MQNETGARDRESKVAGTAMTDDERGESGTCGCTRGRHVNFETRSRRLGAVFEIMYTMDGRELLICIDADA